MNKKSKLTNLERTNIVLTSRQKSILIGIKLSDGWMQSRHGWNPRIAIKQSVKNFNYLWIIFEDLASLCSIYPYSTKNLKKGKLFYSITLQTRQLNCLILIRSLFYTEISKNKFIRAIQFDLFYYLDYISLAHWIKGDGAKHNNGIVLCTDGFTIKEVVFLINILYIKFDIKPRKHMTSIYNYPRITISKKDMLKIRPFILPYFVDHFLYKIYL